MLSDGGNAHFNDRWESTAAKSQQYTSDHGSRPTLQAVVYPRCGRLDARKVHFSDEQQQQQHTDDATGHQYPHDHHTLYTRLVPARDSQQFGHAVDNKPLSTHCTWNVTGVRDTESYDVIPLPSGGSVERDQKPHSNITKPKHEVTFTHVSNTMLLLFLLC